MRQKPPEPDENRGFLSAVFAECGAGMHQAFLRLARLPERRRLSEHIVPLRQGSHPTKGFAGLSSGAGFRGLVGGAAFSRGFRRKMLYNKAEGQMRSPSWQRKT